MYFFEGVKRIVHIQYNTAAWYSQTFLWYGIPFNRRFGIGPTMRDIIGLVNERCQKRLLRLTQKAVKQTLQHGVKFGALQKKSGRYQLGPVLKKFRVKENLNIKTVARRRRRRSSRARRRRRRRPASGTETEDDNN